MKSLERCGPFFGNNKNIILCAIFFFLSKKKLF